MGKVISRILTFIFLGLFLTLLQACNFDQPTQTAQFSETKAECTATAIPNSYVVHWRDGSVDVYKGITREDFEKQVFEPNKEMIRLAEQDQVVKLDQPRAEGQVSASATDDTWGQSIVNANAAWAKGVYGDGVTVAVVDSGVDLVHPQLAGRIWVNPNEIPNNGIDDDKNGLIDDVKGWDFSTNIAQVGDDAGHGTHVAGIIAAEHDKGIVKGMAPHAKIMPLRFMDSQGSGVISDAIRAINYAAANGARVINASWGGAPCSQTLQNTIGELANKNVLFVVAAGNDGINLDSSPEYPASFLGATQITVGASTARDYTAAFSNYSFKFVQLFAPGMGIVSTYPGARTMSLSGTSMAAPFVAGAAALILSNDRNLTAVKLKEELNTSVQKGDFAASSQGRLSLNGLF